MDKESSSQQKLYLGFDVSEKSIEVFGVCGTQSTEKAIRIENSRSSIQSLLTHLKDKEQVCIVMETGTHSTWMSRYIREIGFEVIVSHARDLALIYGASKKNDRIDAEKLARLAQADRKLLHPIEHMSEERQQDLMIIKCRALLIKQRTQLINTIRGMLRTFGIKDHSTSVRNVKNFELSNLPSQVITALSPLLQQIRFTEMQIRYYDREITKLCKKYQVTEILRQIRGVGPAISLTFVLLVGDISRFPDPKRLAAYFGVVPKQDQSGETDKQTNITKAGNSLMRVLLIQGAQYILGPFGTECDLRDYGKRIEARGGAIAKKKARVAVARKLIILMHRLWSNPEKEYIPCFKALNREKHIKLRKVLEQQGYRQGIIHNPLTNLV